MNRCILHIGMHKTGSTSIQSSLKGFSDNAFYYAELPAGPNHSLAICSLFAEYPERHHLHHGKKIADIGRYISEVAKNLDQSITVAQGRTLLISGEGISLLPYGSVQALHQLLSKHFEDITVVGYVRPPVGFMTSAFQESVKVVANSNFNMEREYKNYRNTFGKFDDIFDAKNVQLWKFDPKSFPDGCVVQDFCLRLGIALPKMNIVRVNESLSLQAVALLYIYRKFGQMFGADTLKGKDSILLGNAIKGIGNERLRFAPEIISPILKKNIHDIQWMESRIGQSLDEDISSVCKEHEIKNEDGLIQVGLAIRAKLVELVGSKPELVDRVGDSPEAIAYLVGQLREKVTNSASSQVKVLSGNIGHASTNQVTGWAIGINPALPVRVKIKVNGEFVGEQTADLFRPGLKDRGLHPTGLCGFCFAFSEEHRLNSGDSVTVEPMDDSFTLANSPYKLV